MADHSRSYENPLHMLGHCRHYRRAVAARIELAATLSADGTAPNVYGTAHAAVAIVLRAVWQVPHR
jgi:copper homeostasis protein CutC